MSSDPLFFSAMYTEFEFANINTLNINFRKLQHAVWHVSQLMQNSI